MACFTIKNLTFSYPGIEKKALFDISLEIQTGEYIVLCGKSGSGKTTDRKSTRLNSSHITRSRMPSSA